MIVTLSRLAIGASALGLITACQTTHPPAPAEGQSLQQRAENAFAQDREAILAMAGDYRVRFDFTETVALLEGYELADEKISGGFEVVRVIEDDGDFISLQHLLVVGPEDAPVVVKHWRQDWQYQPSDVMVFIGGNAWEIRNVPEAQRSASWSQTVYQVDDAPRYGAVGRWMHNDGVSQWVPPAEWRPLPRRDMTTRDDYHAIQAVNQHTITPEGWAHEQNNTKLILDGEMPSALVREIGINTYRHSTEFDPAPAEQYWAATETYWSLIRAEWSRIAREHDAFAIDLRGETEAMYLPLLSIAEDVAAGEVTAEEGAASAREIMSELILTDLPPLTQRLRPTSTQSD